jgi:type VI secretion system secreted protein VgrG
MARTFELVTPLGPDVLLFHRMRAREELSRVGEFDIEVLSKRGDVNLDGILAKKVTLKIELPKDKIRYFNGFVTRFAQIGMRGRYHLYRATVRPWLWFLTRTADCRIFQDMSATDIIKKVFQDHSIADFELKTTLNYRKREYCVQYRETDYNFVSRLMEEEGMYFFFKHADGRHTLVVADSYSAHQTFEGYAEIPFTQVERTSRIEKEYIHEWYFAREVQAGRYVLDDFDFKKPSVELEVKTNQKRSNDQADHEVYDYPGNYLITGDGNQIVKTRLDELQARFELANGSTNARGVCVGSLFKLSGQPRSDQNREYLVQSAEYDLEYSEYEAMESAGVNFGCRFRVLESKTTFRPQRLTAKPIVQGPQTAIVVGPSGDEIYTDKYGRVKVQFHWDRYGKKDENSSCWVRVSHPWAGKNWGMVAIPRMGQEVIVDFLEGDPDRPIITGRVYNEEQMPPYELPANKTQTGAKSRSSMKGGAANFNEIRFEDKKGEEQVYIHAEKNQDNIVENDETTDVGHDRTENVHNNEKITIGVDRTENVGNNETIAIGVNRTETVGANESITVGANRTVSVGASETKTVALQRTHMVGVNETIGIGAAQEVAIGAFQAVAIGAYQTVNVGANQSTSVGANRSVTVGSAQTTSVGSNASLKVGGNLDENVTGNHMENVGKSVKIEAGQDGAFTVAKNLNLVAGEQIVIKTGDASIIMKKDGSIMIKGKDIKIEGSGKVIAKASGEMVIKGQSKVTIN